MKKDYRVKSVIPKQTHLLYCTRVAFARGGAPPQIKIEKNGFTLNFLNEKGLSSNIGNPSNNTYLLCDVRVAFARGRHFLTT